MLALNKYTDNLAAEFLTLVKAEEVQDKDLFILQQKVFNNLLEAETEKTSAELDIASIDLAIMGQVMANKSLSNETLRRSAKLALEQENLQLQNLQEQLIAIKLKIKSLEFLNGQIRSVFAS